MIQKIHYGNRIRVAEINYHPLVKVVNIHLVHDTLEIKFDNDVTQMINCWKQFNI